MSIRDLAGAAHEAFASHPEWMPTRGIWGNAEQCRLCAASAVVHNASPTPPADQWFMGHCCWTYDITAEEFIDFVNGWDGVPTNSNPPSDAWLVGRSLALELNAKEA